MALTIRLLPQVLIGLASGVTREAAPPVVIARACAHRVAGRAYGLCVVLASATQDIGALLILTKDLDKKRERKEKLPTERQKVREGVEDIKKSYF